MLLVAYLSGYVMPDSVINDIISAVLRIRMCLLFTIWDSPIQIAIVNRTANCVQISGHKIELNYLCAMLADSSSCGVFRPTHKNYAFPSGMRFC